MPSDPKTEAGASFDGRTVESPPRPQSSPEPQLARGSGLGRYVVLERLGKGGMGEVYAAYDPVLDRAVALKRLTGERAFSEVAQARLVREAQAMARLAHPNVVAVHELATLDGQLFVVMEWVRGVTLRDWLAECHRPWKEVRDVFCQAGGGLVAAHAVGIVHRDFKPENVLIGADGRPRVTDFGIARSSEPEVTPTGQPVPKGRDPHLTQTGAIVGTPGYMAPEQLRGQAVGPKTDQFSFCAALYEGLYGELPYRAANLFDLAQVLEEGQVASAPEATAVPAWLRKVLLRGLRPNPDDRYPSMEELLVALATDPARKLRRLGARSLTALSLSALVAAAVVATWSRSKPPCAQAGQAGETLLSAQRERALETAFLATHLPYAEQAWRGTRQALHTYVDAWSQARVSACEATHVRGEQSEEMLELRLACLDRRRSELAALLEVLGRADPVAVEHALESTLALAPIDACADRARLRSVVRPAAGASSPERLEAVRAELARAKATLHTGQYREALRLAEESSRSAQLSSYPPLVADGQLVLGEAQWKTGDFQSARRSLMGAQAAALQGRDDDLALTAVTHLARLTGIELTRLEESEAWLALAFELQSRLEPSESREAALLTARGRLTERTGRYDAALGDLRRAYELRRKTEAAGSPAASAALNDLGGLLANQGSFDEATGLYADGLAAAQKTLGDSHPIVADLLTSAGRVKSRQGRNEEALADLRRSLALREASLGVDHPTSSGTLVQLGNALEALGRFEEARAAYVRALTIRQTHLGELNPEVASDWVELCAVDNQLGRRREAELECGRALELMARANATEPELAYVELVTSTVLADSGQFGKALGHAQRALSLFERNMGPSNPNTAFALVGVGVAYLGLRQPSQALPLLERAVEVRTNLTEDPSGLAQAQFALARALWDAGQDRARARTLATQALATFRDGGESARKERLATEAWLRRVGP